MLEYNPGGDIHKYDAWVLTPNVVIFATTSSFTLDQAERLYSSQYEVKNQGPSWEPKKGMSRRPATSKNDQVVLNHVESGAGNVEVVLSSDVVFLWENERQHRSNRDGDLDTEKIEAITREAKKRYEHPFDAEWEVSFAATILPTKERRLTTFRIRAQFPDGIPGKDIEENVMASSNALIKLVELGQKHGALFFARQRGAEEEVAISSELATMLIRDKILPIASFQELISKQVDSPEKYRPKHTQTEWTIVPLTLINALSKIED